MSALVAFGSLSGTGCIIAEPPDYGPPERSPIVIYNPIPNPESMQVLSREDASFKFGATIRSEDAGEQVLHFLYRDYQHSDEDFLPGFLPPQTFDKERPISYNVTPSRFFTDPTTCHAVTLLVMHQSSWNQTTFRFEGPPDDLATFTWYVTVDDDGTVKAQDCPTAGDED